MPALSLSLVIISYESFPVLPACLQNASTSGCISHLIVVDNGSTDETRQFIPTHFPQVKLIANPTNLGFAAACNQGIRASTDDLVLILNPDVILLPNALERLVGFMTAESPVGACGPRLLNFDQSLQPSCRRYPTLRRLVLDELGLGKLFPKSKVFGDYRMTWWNHDEQREVDQLMGAALLLRRKALEEVGFFDEQFFMYFEEVDLCLRLQQKGWKLWFVPAAEVIHAGGESARKNFVNATFWRYQSMCKFYRKHYPLWHLGILKGVIGLAGLARILAYSLPPFRSDEKRKAFVKITSHLYSL